MAFKLIVSKRAQSEIENAIDYYAEINKTLALRFYSCVEQVYDILKINPFYKKIHNDFRIVPIGTFPFNIIFHIEEANKTIKILSCFHTSRNTINYPR